MLASEKGYVSNVQALLKLGIDVDLADNVILTTAGFHPIVL
jgi:hypothetical protein